MSTRREPGLAHHSGTVYSSIFRPCHQQARSPSASATHYPPRPRTMRARQEAVGQRTTDTSRTRQPELVRSSCTTHATQHTPQSSPEQSTSPERAPKSTRAAVHVHLRHEDTLARCRHHRLKRAADTTTPHNVPLYALEEDGRTPRHGSPRSTHAPHSQRTKSGFSKILVERSSSPIYSPFDHSLPGITV